MAALSTALAAFALFYVVQLYLALRRRTGADKGVPKPSPAGLATGFGTNFFDTLGIGSFAPTTAILRQWRLVADENLPGTLHVGHTLPAVLQAFLFIQIVEVDLLTLTLMIGSASMGAWLGAGVVSRLPRRGIQVGMGVALLCAATLLLLRQLNIGPPGGTALALTGAKLAIGVALNFVLGALMTLGIGLYAPCMIVIALLGMDPTASFPIMMGSCAFLMPVASVRFARSGRFDAPIALGVMLGGIPAVLIAAFLVKSLSLTTVRWLVVTVAIYTAAGLLRRGLVRTPNET